MSPGKRVNILQTPIDALTMEETLEVIDAGISNQRMLRHACVNAAVLIAMQKDPMLKKSITSCDIINADGKSVVWASRFLGKPLPERVAGPDLMHEVVKLASRKGYRIFLLGAREEVVKNVAAVYGSLFSPDIVSGYHNGYFGKEDEPALVRQIADSRSHILFVAMTSPKKELFLEKYAEQLRVPFVMGVGGAFDIVAGLIKRAPVWMQRSGLEWLYRLVQEPRRMWKRYLVTNSLFIYSVLREKLASNSDLQTGL
jgi:N-acetylglucosaminyldiphosphoundecaprenol N-acetyl-beta-D-mannosaminyltransferase